VGLHSDEDTPALENPSDPPANSTSAAITPSPTSAASTKSPTTSAVAESSPKEDSEDADNEDEHPSTWWGALWDKTEDLKDWAGDIIDTVKDNFA
jgi:hypothetical protein